MIHKIWGKLTGDERLFHIERSLQKKMLECSDEEEWKKLNQQRKKIRKKRKKICLQSRIAAGIIVLITLLCISITGVRSLIKHPAQHQIQKQSETVQTKQIETEDEGEPVELLLSFTGDCILGTDEYFAWDTGLPAYYDLYGPAYFLKNVRSIFKEDDLTIVNMEGTLTEETTRVEKQFAFKGNPEYVKILTSSSVEAANVANNHSHDYGEKSFRDTVDILEKHGIRTFGYDDTAILEEKGIRVGLFGIYELDDHLERIPQVKRDIASLKKQNADIIVAVFHWSNELVTVPDENQVTLAHFAIDEGA